MTAEITFQRKNLKKQPTEDQEGSAGQRETADFRQIHTVPTESRRSSADEWDELAEYLNQEHSIKKNELTDSQKQFQLYQKQLSQEEIELQRNIPGNEQDSED